MEGTLVISNTTPLINFSEIGRLDVLTQLFGAVVIPPEVQRESLEKAVLFPSAAETVLQQKLTVLAPKDLLLVQALSAQVHPGEAECLALAIEHPGSLLLLDDLAARELAAAHGCLFTGTIGCLAEAKRRGIVPALAPLLEDLRRRARFWIADKLAVQVLRDAGEA